MWNGAIYSISDQVVLYNSYYIGLHDPTASPAWKRWRRARRQFPMAAIYLRSWRGRESRPAHQATSGTASHLDNPRRQLCRVIAGPGYTSIIVYTNLSCADEQKIYTRSTRVFARNLLTVVTSSVAAGFGRHGMPPPVCDPDV